MGTGTTGQSGDHQPSSNNKLSVRIFDVIIFKELIRAAEPI